MTYSIDATHAPSLKSWVESANQPGCDFPIQNLPFGRFRRKGASGGLAIGVAIGDQVLDLRAAGLVETDDINALIGQPAAERAELRRRISAGLAQGSADEAAWRAALVPQAQVEMAVPCHIGDYTDFYTSVHHATSIGRQFRPDAPLLPNYKWVPIGYHGRASSIAVSGQHFPRPVGQTKAPDAATPSVGPCKRLDYELELGWITGAGNAQGERVSIDDAESHLFGVTLFNDWSARDIQAWEYQPLGPFLSKNFASTISPWIVTMEALAPFRLPFARGEGEPQPLPYLSGEANSRAGAVDITIEVWLQTRRMREAGQPGVRLSHGNAAEAAYWTPAQLVAHHTVNGCNLQPGDLLGSGTLSGPKPDQAGSLLELSTGGKQPVDLGNGETRTFLEDGDALTIRGWCERAGAVRIGLGEVTGTVEPARALAG